MSSATSSSAKGANSALRVGATTEDEIYHAVGRALSTWEASEDALMGLFRQMSGDLQSIAAEAYVHAPRNVRKQMVLLGLEQNQRGYGPDRLSPEQCTAIKKALAKSDKLAETRNRIAHGCCTKFTSHEDGKLTADGYFLLPAFNEPQSLQRSMRFAYNLDDIQEFVAGSDWCRSVFSSAGESIKLARRSFYEKLPKSAGPILSFARNATTDFGAIEPALMALRLTPWGRESFGIPDDDET